MKLKYNRRIFLVKIFRSKIVLILALALFIMSPYPCRIHSYIYRSADIIDHLQKLMHNFTVNVNNANFTCPQEKSMTLLKQKEEPRRSVVFPLTLTGDYILNSPKICSGVGRVMALVMVHTAPKHFVRRQNIRSTYGSRHLFGKHIRVLFLLGKVKNKQLQKKIVAEHKKHHDIIQGNFIDSYHNLTHKGVMGFRWITEHCSHVKYVVKVDDDAVFDMWRFLNAFSHKNKSRSIYCNAIHSGRIFREGKWKMEDSFMNGTERWPWTYCPGFVVILTGDVIKPLFQAAHTTPFLWIDDVYLYGYLPHQAKNIHIYQLQGNLQVHPFNKGVKCLKNRGEKCKFMAVTGNEKTYMKHWKLIRKRNKH